MKKLALLASLSMMLLSCNFNTTEKPEDLLSEDQMVAILYDLYVINAMKSGNMEYLKKHNITPANYILQKYKVDSLQFSTSDRYYAADLEVYEKLYQQVTQKLKEDKAVLDSLAGVIPESEVKLKSRVEKTIPLTAKDTMRKRGAGRATLFKDSIKN
jgi:Tfp pilus assembly protein PilN